MREFPVPQAGDDDGVLEIEVTGVCGSDVFHYNGDAAPVILGHEEQAQPALCCST